MPNNENIPATYAEVKVRLDQIVDAVQDENLPLDEALGLYEEAVKLGSQVSNLIEQGIEQSKENAEDEAVAEAAEDAEEATDAEDAQAEEA